MPVQDIKKVKWEEIQDRVHHVNGLAAEAISAIPENDRPPLYLASYPFGAHLIESGLAHIPHQNELYSVTSQDLPNEIREDLGYAEIPLMLFLNKTSELFLNLNNRTYPLHFFHPGKLLGLWPILDLTKYAESTVYHRGMWSLAVGARTVFMLPKVMDYGSHSKMQRQLQLEEAYPPHNLFDQGPVFADIAGSTKLKCDWSSEVLFFSKSWADALKSNPKFTDLKNVLLQQEWDNTLSLRNHIGVEVIWQVLAQAQAQTRIKPNTYVIDTVKHLVNIAMNSAPGFRPLSETDEITAPVQTIQNAYLEYYQLKNYIPTLLAPSYLKDHASVYYSFLCPTLLSLSPNHNFRNTLEDERNIKYILQLFQDELAQYDVYQRVLPSDIQFDFFHFESDSIHNILPVNQLPKIDPSLSRFPQNKQLVFSENAPFLRACVKLTASDNNA